MPEQALGEVFSWVWDRFGTTGVCITIFLLVMRRVSIYLASVVDFFKDDIKDTIVAHKNLVIKLDGTLDEGTIQLRKIVDTQGNHGTMIKEIHENVTRKSVVAAV